MKEVKLDLSKFKHIASDDKTTTLRHYEGHTVTLAHKPLSKANREALKAMAEKAQLKAEAKGDGKPSTPEMLADGGKVEGKKVLTGVKTSSAAKGVEMANKARAEGDASPNGVTVQVRSSEEQSKTDFGQIRSSAHGERPKVYAEGGEVKKSNPSEMSLDNLVAGIKDAVSPKSSSTPPPAPIHNQYGSSKYAEGGDVVPPALDPNAPQMASKPLDFTGLPDVSSEGATNLGKAIEAQPAERLEHFKQAGFTDPESEQQMLAQLTKEKAAREQGAIDRTQSTGASAQSHFNQLTQSAQQKQALGIPLSAEEQQALNAPQQPASPGSMQPDPSVQAAAQQSQGLGATPQPNAMASGINDIEGMMQQGYHNQLTGINAQAAAQGELGKQQAAMLQKQQDAQMIAKKHFDDSFSKLDNERQALVKDVQDGHVDPNKYWTGDSNGNGSHSKIMSGIGMILAGFNPTSSPNAAINFLKYQMDQNIQAQAKNLDAKQNLLASNLRQFGNLKDATEMTRIMQSDMVSNQLQQAAATAQSPLAKAAALQAAGQLQMQTAPMFQQFAMRRAMMNLGNSTEGQQNPQAIEQMIGYMRMTNPELAKDMQSRYVPGVGLSSIPVPQEVRSEIVGKQNFNQMAQHYVDFVKQNAGSLNPKVINQGTTMAAELQGAYRNAVKGGVYKEGEQQFIEKLIPSDPTQFAGSIRTLPKLQSLIQSNDSQLNQIKKGYGLPGSHQQQQAAEPQYATKGGVKYMKVPGGWKIAK